MRNISPEYSVLLASFTLIHYLGFSFRVTSLNHDQLDLYRSQYNYQYILSLYDCIIANIFLLRFYLYNIRIVEEPLELHY